MVVFSVQDSIGFSLLCFLFPEGLVCFLKATPLFLALWESTRRPFPSAGCGIWFPHDSSSNCVVPELAVAPDFFFFIQVQALPFKEIYHFFFVILFLFFPSNIDLRVLGRWLAVDPTFSYASLSCFLQSAFKSS